MDIYDNTLMLAESINFLIQISSQTRVQSRCRTALKEFEIAEKRKNFFDAFIKKYSVSELTRFLSRISYLCEKQSIFLSNKQTIVHFEL